MLILPLILQSSLSQGAHPTYNITIIFISRCLFCLKYYNCFYLKVLILPIILQSSLSQGAHPIILQWSLFQGAHPIILQLSVSKGFHPIILQLSLSQGAHPTYNITIVFISRCSSYL